MKLRKISLSILVGLFVMLVTANAVFADPLGQDNPNDPDDTIQVVLVLDVSDSMKHPILSDDLPQELLALNDEIAAIEGGTELQEINDQLAALVEAPEFLAATDALQTAVDDLDAWFLENEFGDSLESIRVGIGRTLAENSCSAAAQFTLQMAVSLTLAELDHWIDQACADAGISLEQKQTLRDTVPYLGDPEYIPLRETYVEKQNGRTEAMETLGYFDLMTQRDQYFVDANYELLKGDYENMIDDLGIPRKIDLAKLAARTLLDLSRLDETAGCRVSIVGLVIFSTESALIQELTPDLDSVEGKIIQLEPQFQTNIYAALDDALEELVRNADHTKPTLVILLSDGQTNVGPGEDQILAEIPVRANEMDTTICTVGIGPTEAHVDWDLLRGLADKTDGEYLFARKGEELVNFFVACRQGIVGEVKQVAGYVSPNQPSQVDPITVGANVCEMSLALNFVSGGPVLEIVDPDGTGVESGYPKFSVQRSDNISLYTLLAPIEGEWDVTVNSGDAPDEDVFYNIVITSNDCVAEPTPDVTPTPSPTRTPIPEAGIVEKATPIIPLVILVIVVMGVFIVITFRRK
ncbi:MAG: VWA domain-containing protein [Anaerolineales bacterium]|nr:VWA domain-containing protein [Anaerolineales bacterium]